MSAKAKVSFADAWKNQYINSCNINMIPPASTPGAFGLMSWRLTPNLLATLRVGPHETIKTVHPVAALAALKHLSDASAVVLGTPQHPNKFQSPAETGFECLDDMPRAEFVWNMLLQCIGGPWTRRQFPAELVFQNNFKYSKLATTALGAALNVPGYNHNTHNGPSRTGEPVQDANEIQANEIDSLNLVADYGASPKINWHQRTVGTSPWTVSGRPVWLLMIERLLICSDCLDHIYANATRPAEFISPVVVLFALFLSLKQKYGADIVMPWLHLLLFERTESDSPSASTSVGTHILANIIFTHVVHEAKLLVDNETSNAANMLTEGQKASRNVVIKTVLAHATRLVCLPQQYFEAFQHHGQSKSTVPSCPWQLVNREALQPLQVPPPQQELFAMEEQKHEEQHPAFEHHEQKHEAFSPFKDGVMFSPSPSSPLPMAIDTQSPSTPLSSPPSSPIYSPTSPSFVPVFEPKLKLPASRPRPPARPFLLEPFVRVKTTKPARQARLPEHERLRLDLHNDERVVFQSTAPIAHVSTRAQTRSIIHPYFG